MIGLAMFGGIYLWLVRSLLGAAACSYALDHGLHIATAFIVGSAVSGAVGMLLGLVVREP